MDTENAQVDCPIQETHYITVDYVVYDFRAGFLFKTDTEQVSARWKRIKRMYAAGRPNASNPTLSSIVVHADVVGFGVLRRPSNRLADVGETVSHVGVV